MKKLLTGFAVKSEETYFIMAVQKYDKLANIVNNFKNVANVPFRIGESVHIWLGKDFKKLIDSCGQTLPEALADMGVFQIMVDIKKASNGNVNFTTVGRPIPVSEP